ncbi:hypothetical protein ACLBKU_12035 [Erythrobacter sp. NE805]|uniref:hypothetical protein n=1 Tax=Erythrobacter sp. NE805 TaxID=3389875 RepID=UPI00396B0A04
MARVRTVTDTLEFEGERYTLVFDFEVIADFEEGLGVSIGDVLNPPGGGSPMVSRLARLMLAAIRRHHPDADLNLAGAMMTDPAIAAQFYGAVTSSMPQAGDVEGEAGSAATANPPNRRARRAAASAGKTGSSPRPKRG